jgi:hypothetical protein
MARKKLGYRGHEDWEDVSDYVVHFTKQWNGDTPYQNMMSILWDRRLEPGPDAFGAAKNLGWLGDSQRCVCFSEIPLGFLKRLVSRRSHFGLAFRKEFLVKEGGAPVWYLEHGTPAYDHFRTALKPAIAAKEPEHPLFALTPFVDHPAGGAPDAPYNYRWEWEREWRANRTIDFKEEDVAFLFIAEHQHVAARKFFEGHIEEQTGPGYLCPYIDPTWSAERVKEALDQVPPSGVPGLPQPRTRRR